MKKYIHQDRFKSNTKYNNVGKKSAAVTLNEQQ